MMSHLENAQARFPKVDPDCDPRVQMEHKVFDEHAIWRPFEGQRTLDDDEI